MGNNTAAVTTVFLVALLLLLFSGTSNAAILNGLIVRGRICCTLAGSCPGQGVGGVAVRLNCSINGRMSTVGGGVTDPMGAYSITIPNLPGLALGLPVVPCVVVVPLQLQGGLCPVLSSTSGFLVGALRDVGTASSVVLGLLQAATVDGYVRTLT